MNERTVTVHVVGLRSDGPNNGARQCANTSSFTRFWVAVQSFCGSRWVASQNGFHWNLDAPNAHKPHPSSFWSTGTCTCLAPHVGTISCDDSSTFTKQALAQKHTHIPTQEIRRAHTTATTATSQQRSSLVRMSTSTKGRAKLLHDWASHYRNRFKLMWGFLSCALRSRHRY